MSVRAAANTHRRWAVGLALSFALALAAPALAGTLVTNPEPDKPCPSGFGDGVLTQYSTTLNTPSDSANWSVTIDLTVEGGTCAFSLATYELASGSFTLPQTLFDSASGTFGPGTHTLTAALPHLADMPGCFSQYDFVFGSAIQTLSASDRYGDRIIRARIAGTADCTESNVGGGTPTPTPTPTPSPTQEVQGGTGTPAPSEVPDTAMSSTGASQLPWLGGVTFAISLLGYAVLLKRFSKAA